MTIVELRKAVEESDRLVKGVSNNCVGGGASGLLKALSGGFVKNLVRGIFEGKNKLIVLNRNKTMSMVEADVKAAVRRLEVDVGSMYDWDEVTIVRFMVEAGGYSEKPKRPERAKSERASFERWCSRNLNRISPTQARGKGAIWLTKSGILYNIPFGGHDELSQWEHHDFFTVTRAVRIRYERKELNIEYGSVGISNEQKQTLRDIVVQNALVEGQVFVDGSNSGALERWLVKSNMVELRKAVGESEQTIKGARLNRLGRGARVAIQGIGANMGAVDEDKFDRSVQAPELLYDLVDEGIRRLRNRRKR